MEDKIQNKFYPTENKGRTQREQTSNRVSYIYLIGFLLILALPLLSIPPWFHPAAWGKAIVFRIILSILLFLFIWEILFKKNHVSLKNLREIFSKENKVSPICWILVILWGIFFLATIFSANPFFSFWGSPYRAGGFLNFSFYILFAFLTFLIIKKKDWKKLWIVSLVVGAVASIIAILQQFGVFEKQLISYAARPISTFGNPNFLAVYLLILIFITLSFALGEKSIKKKLLYFAVLLLFLYAVSVTETRAVYLGLFIGALYFVFFYKSASKKIKRLKVSFLIVLLLGTLGFCIIKNSSIDNLVINRISSISLTAGEARISGWKISLKAIKEKPIFGWGPENFSIGFDKYFDHSLPGLSTPLEENWWDKTHNFIFDISVTAGIPALIIYLSLFGALLWQLQKVKNNEQTPKPKRITIHASQAAFIGYLVANFFSFDVFSTYLVSFLLIGFSLSLISQNNVIPETAKKKAAPWKYIFILILFCFLFWFVFSFNLKPLKINKEINWANFYAHQKGECRKAVNVMENLLPSHSFIDHYLRLNYIDIIGKCVSVPDYRTPLALKAMEILKENVEIRPNYTRNWLFLGGYANFLIELKDPQLSPEFIENLKIEADKALEKANELSPKRQQILSEWARINLLRGKYQETKEKSEQCINLDPKFAECWWKKGLAEIYLGQIEEGEKDIEIASQKGHNINDQSSLQQLLNAYVKSAKSPDLKIYQTLAEIYKKLLESDYRYFQNFQYHASLAFVYKTLGEYEKAREEAMLVLKYSPESKQVIEEFLRTLPR